MVVDLWKGHLLVMLIGEKMYDWRLYRGPLVGGGGANLGNLDLQVD